MAGEAGNQSFIARISIFNGGQERSLQTATCHIAGPLGKIVKQQTENKKYRYENWNYFRDKRI